MNESKDKLKSKYDDEFDIARHIFFSGSCEEEQVQPRSRLTANTSTICTTQEPLLDGKGGTSAAR